MHDLISDKNSDHNIERWSRWYPILQANDLEEEYDL